jgi:quinoprotein glucose dehydrogenase
LLGRLASPYTFSSLDFPLMHPLFRGPLILLVALLAPVPALALPAGFEVETRYSALNFPTKLVFTPNGRLLYTELGGRIMSINLEAGTQPTVWATLSVANSGEQGLLGMVLHRDFPDSPFVYVFLTNPNPLEDRIVRLTYSDAFGYNEMVMFRIAGVGQDHHGGRMAYGPDGMLYVTVGEAGDAANAQDVNDARGKILRLGPGFKPAPANPFGPNNPAALYGVRNPFGLCFDPLDGTGYFTENGPECDDEVNLISFGADYGWGPNDFCHGQPAGTQPAITMFTPTIAPTGACLYRGSSFPPYLDGNLFFASYLSGAVRRIKFVPGTLDQADTVDVFHAAGNPVIDVVEGPDGNLWFCTPTTIQRISYPHFAGVTDRRPTNVQLTAWPNPWNDEIRFQLPPGVATGMLEIFGLEGRRVARLEVPRTGVLRWNGRGDGGSAVPSGVYFARVDVPGGKATRRLIKLAR